VNCIFCGAPLAKKGLNCNYCKKLNPINIKLFEVEERRESKYLCPYCKINLEILETSTVNLEYCKSCDGVFITEEELEEFISYKVNLLHKFTPYYLRFIQDNPRDNRKKPQPQFCPICQETMSIVNYKKRSGIILDVCEEHGIWLDGGELYQVIEWYFVGGNKKKQNRDGN